MTRMLFESGSSRIFRSDGGCAETWAQAMNMVNTITARYLAGFRSMHQSVTSRINECSFETAIHPFQHPFYTWVYNFIHQSTQVQNKGMKYSVTGYRIPGKIRKSSIFFPVLAPWRSHPRVTASSLICLSNNKSIVSDVTRT